MKLTGTGIAAAVVIALLPFFTIGSLLYGDVTSKFFLLVAATDVLALLAAYRLWKGGVSTIKGRWLLGALGLVVLTQLLAAATGVFWGRSLWSDIFWMSGVFYLVHLAVAAVVLGEYLTARDWSLIRRALALSAGVLGLLSILGIHGLGATGRFLHIPLGSAGLTLGNETYAGAYLLLAFVLGLIEFLHAKGAKLRAALAASLVCIALSPLLFNLGFIFGRTSIDEVLGNPALLFGTARASSAAFFALLAFLAGYFLLRRFVHGKARRPVRIAWSAAVLAGLSAVVALLFFPGSAVQQAYSAASTEARVIVWEASWDAFLDRPLLGWGPENFNHAFEANFDSRIFEEENLGEIWFERAHNVFFDTLVASGIIGFLALALLIVLYLIVISRAWRRGVLAETEAVLLLALVPVHLLQMQTGFDTIGSYALLALALGYALSLEREGERGAGRVPLSITKGAAVILAFLALASMWLVTLEYQRHVALTQTLTSRTAADQKAAIEASLGRISSFEALRLSYASFVKGSLALLAENPTPERTKVVLEFMGIYNRHFERFIAVKPDSYRARVNYAYLLLLQTALGENRLDKANEMIQAAYPLAPGHPVTYVLDSVAHLYAGDLKEADRLMAEALAINPDVEFTQEAAQYLATQKKTFPSISVLKLTNL